ncbi:expressed unknown protein [Seminavis robusta]|uniref:Uncharacterized protein n=1 Tax=Seminavis robusta TaxID=568900 RepID=A0A9N8F008_9STRA|nr:expressed unknown protein [Seminavis robusta]|eukprot:Sro2297_g322411.1  (142) ;mRNA; r:10516-10941
MVQTLYLLLATRIILSTTIFPHLHGDSRLKAESGPASQPHMSPIVSSLEVADNEIGLMDSSILHSLAAQSTSRVPQSLSAPPAWTGTGTVRSTVCIPEACGCNYVITLPNFKSSSIVVRKPATNCVQGDFCDGSSDIVASL